MDVTLTIDIFCLQDTILCHLQFSYMFCVSDTLEQQKSSNHLQRFENYVQLLPT